MILVIDGRYGQTFEWPNFEAEVLGRRVSPTHAEFTTVGSYNAMLKTLSVATKSSGFLSYAGSLADSYVIYNEYSDGKISGARATYRFTGVAASVAAPIIMSALIGSQAGPAGTMVGFLVGIEFTAIEYFYDSFGKPALNRTVWELNNVEKSFKNGNFEWLKNIQW